MRSRGQDSCCHSLSLFLQISQRKYLTPALETLPSKCQPETPLAMCSETVVRAAVKRGDSCKLCIASKLRGLVFFTLFVFSIAPQTSCILGFSGLSLFYWPEASIVLLGLFWYKRCSNKYHHIITNSFN